MIDDRSMKTQEDDFSNDAFQQGHQNGSMSL